MFLFQPKDPIISFNRTAFSINQSITPTILRVVEANKFYEQKHIIQENYRVPHEMDLLLGIYPQLLLISSVNIKF